MKIYTSKSARIIMLFILGCAYMVARYLFDFSPLVGWSILFSFILFAFFIERLFTRWINVLVNYLIILSYNINNREDLYGIFLRIIVILCLLGVYNLVYNKYYDFLSNYAMIAIVVLAIAIFLTLTLLDKIYASIKKSTKWYFEIVFVTIQSIILYNSVRIIKCTIKWWLYLES